MSGNNEMLLTIKIHFFQQIKIRTRDIYHWHKQKHTGDLTQKSMVCM